MGHQSLCIGLSLRSTENARKHRENQREFEEEGREEKPARPEERILYSF